MAGAKGSSPFAWDDPFLLEAQLTRKRMIRDTARPTCRSAWRRTHLTRFDFFENQP